MDTFVSVQNVSHVKWWIRMFFVVCFGFGCCLFLFFVYFYFVFCVSWSLFKCHSVRERQALVIIIFCAFLAIFRHKNIYLSFSQGTNGTVCVCVCVLRFNCVPAQFLETERALVFTCNWSEITTKMSWRSNELWLHVGFFLQLYSDMCHLKNFMGGFFFWPLFVRSKQLCHYEIGRDANSKPKI